VLAIECRAWIYIAVKGEGGEEGEADWFRPEALGGCEGQRVGQQDCLRSSVAPLERGLEEKMPTGSDPGKAASKVAMCLFATSSYTARAAGKVNTKLARASFADSLPLLTRQQLEVPLQLDM